MGGVEWPAFEAAVESLQARLSESYLLVWAAVLVLGVLYLAYRSLPSRSPPAPTADELERLRKARLALIAASAPPPDAAQPKPAAAPPKDSRWELLKPKSQRLPASDYSPLSPAERGRYVPQSRCKPKKGG